MSKKNKKSILSHFKILMLHIIKWESQPERRSKSWKQSIDNSTEAISEIQQEQPSLNNHYLEKHWDKTTQKAVKEAENEMNQKATKTTLSWEEVFSTKYILPVIVITAVLTALFY